MAALEKLRLTAETIALEAVAVAIEGFNCGGDDWAIEVTEWLKAKDGPDCAATALLDPTTQIWLYFSADHELVGYGVIGHGKLKWPKPKNDQIDTSTIPMLGVDARFQGQGHGTTILRDLVDIAKEWAPGRRILVLSVHTKSPAIRLYERHNFLPYGNTRAQGPKNEPYQRYVLDLMPKPAT